MKESINYRGLIDEALTKPGRLSECYQLFYNYSLLNGLYLAMQMDARQIPLGPCGSFGFWKKIGARVKKGAKALTVRVPCIYKKEVKKLVDGEEKTETDEVVGGYVWKAGVFTYAQVEGIEKPAEVLQGFDVNLAISTLKVPVIPFDMINGNCQGFSCEQGIAINPLGSHKVRTTIHEMAHYLLQHSKTRNNNYANNEVEAELVSYLVSHALNLEGADESRGYIQHWLQNNKLEDASAAKVINLASRILKAGRC